MECHRGSRNHFFAFANVDFGFRNPDATFRNPDLAFAKADLSFPKMVSAFAHAALVFANADLAFGTYALRFAEGFNPSYARYALQCYDAVMPADWSVPSNAARPGRPESQPCFS